MRLLVVVFLTFSLANAVSIKEKLKNLQDKFPFLTSWDKAQTAEFLDSQDEQNGRDMKEYLRMLFRAWDFQGTPLGEIIESGQLPDLENLSDKLSLVHIYELLDNDEELRANIKNLYKLKLQRDEKRRTSQYDDEDIDDYESCRRDYSSLVEPITSTLIGIVIPGTPEKTMERWGWAMFDAMTKIPEGLTEGKLHWVGSYEKCNSIQAHYNYTEIPILPGRPTYVQEREFNAKYCRLDFNPIVPRIGNGSDFLRLQLGLCVPDTCNAENMTSYIMEENVLLQVFISVVLGLKIDRVYCGQETDYDNDSSIQAFVGVILTLVILVALSTIYDSFFRLSMMKSYVDGLVKKEKVQYGRSVSQISTAVPEIGRSQGFSGLQRQASNTSYTEVDPSEHRRYSLKGRANVNNSNGTSSTNRSNLSTQISTESTRPLFNEDTETEHEDRPTFLDRIEVLFVGFSAYSNLARIFCVDEGLENELPVINGVRSLSWMYALFGHVWLFGPVYNECWTTGNLVRLIREMPKKWSFQPVINFHFSSDAFFVISGCLVTFYWLRKVEQQGKISVGLIIKYYFFRYWTLMPALMLVLMTYTCTYRYLGSGPLFPPNVRDADNCRTEWWTDLLLIHNIYDPNHMCLTWTWYTGILWQLHIITPIVLIPLVLMPWLGYICLAALYIIHMGATAGVAANLYDNDDSGIGDWFRDYFLTPWCRAGPYCVGIVLGIILHKKRNIKIHPLLAICGWIVALVFICSVEYGTYSVFKEGGSRWDRGTRVMYDTFSRTTFGLGIAWIIFACSTGYGGFINSILSWRVFIPLSRLVYPSYLMHAMMIFTFVYGQYTLLYVNTANVIYWFFGHIWVVHLVGLFFVGLLFHYPLALGVLRAIKVQTKLECVKAGRHPELPSAGAQDKHINYLEILDANNQNQKHKIPHGDTRF